MPRWVHRTKSKGAAPSLADDVGQLPSAEADAIDQIERPFQTVGPRKFDTPADALEVHPRWNVIAIARDLSASGLLHQRNHASPRPINLSQAQDTNTPVGTLQPKTLLLRLKQQAVHRVTPIKWRSPTHLLSTLISKDTDSADVNLSKDFDSLEKTSSQLSVCREGATLISRPSSSSRKLKFA